MKEQARPVEEEGAGDDAFNNKAEPGFAWRLFAADHAETEIAGGG